MSPQRARRHAMVTTGLSLVALLGLIASVWLVGRNATGSVRASEARARAVQAGRDQQARQAQTGQQRLGCARGVARDFEALEVNEALARLARKMGDQRTAELAQFRAERVRLRLPEGRDDASVAEFCVALYPSGG